MAEGAVLASVVVAIEPARELAGSLPMHHRDPFDRLLIAQASVEGIALASGDADVRRYGIEIVW